MWISRLHEAKLLSKLFIVQAPDSLVRDECDLKLKDINYDDSLFYKNLYDHQTTNYVILSAQYGNLSWEYNLLKDEYVDDRIKLRNAIVECVNRLPAELPAPTADRSDAMSNQLA
uniref:Uncharacterized protein n=1 Tax=Ananas comosus var. bracteatus TaxID=296719 RepID=A0A6V7NJK0_ANACO|nr:unnamed protein product [Ananas comosus var. bracteatus]